MISRYRRVRHTFAALSLFIRFPALSFSIILPLLGAATALSWLTRHQILGLIAVATAFHIFAYVLNDVIDLPVDRTESLRADFPLVRGSIQPQYALMVAFIQIPLALLFTAWLGANVQTYMVIIAAFVLMTAYDLWGKRTPFPPLTDLIQGLGWASLVLYGATVVSGHLTVLLGVIFAFVVVFILMINGVHGSLRDLVNDLNCNIHTTAILLGVKPLGTKGLILPLQFMLYALILQILLISIILFPLAYNWVGYQSTTWHITAAMVLISTLLSLILLVLSAKSISNRSLMIKLGILHIVTSLSTLLLLFAALLGSRLLIVVLVVYIIPLCSILLDWLMQSTTKLKSIFPHTLRDKSLND